MGLQGGRKTKTGYSTAADVLEKLAPEYPIVAKILEYRQMAKLKSTYADGLAGFIQADGRIHGKFHQTITAKGRLSSAEPNLQNIPVRMENLRIRNSVNILSLTISIDQHIISGTMRKNTKHIPDGRLHQFCRNS